MDSKLTRRDLMKLAGATAVVAATGRVTGARHASLPAGNAPELPGAFADGKYTLPDLPYAYDALSPLHDERMLRIHHTRHHAGYVRGLNTTLENLHNARTAGDFSRVKALSRALAFHGSGHMLHCLYWNSMTPDGAEPGDELAEAMQKCFGSVEAARKHFAAAAESVEASGWAILAWEPVADRLLVLQAEKHQNLTVWGVIPLLVCDVWEHAYYLQYANERSRWVEAFMEIANWRFASERYTAVRDRWTA
ncbi:MAG: superoxide dismutase [Phycisphaerae bacterium]